MNGDVAWKELLERLHGALERYDREEAGRIVYDLSGRIHKGDAPSDKVAANILGSLRRKRYFELIEQLAETFRFAGLKEPRIRRQYAQALIDQGKSEKAIDTLEALEASTRDVNPEEFAEAQGLLGRVYKQLYVNAVNRDPKAAGSPLIQSHLRRSLDYYRRVYLSAPKVHLWHGINTVALAHRAEADGVAIEDSKGVKSAASSILEDITARDAAAKGDPQKAVPTWDLATAVEASLALKKHKEALGWLDEYIRREDADAFELTSTRRQLREVWRLTPDKPPGATLLPVLDNALLHRQGGRVELQGSEVPAILERTLGTEGASSLPWYRAGLERCLGVGQVCNRFGDATGSGLLLRGRDIDPKYDDRFLFLTNAHVISNDPVVRQEKKALHPDDAVVAFESWPPVRGKKRTFSVSAMLWTSPPDDLDATLVALQPLPGGVQPFPIAREIPKPDGKQKVYIIGHPNGGGLALSLYDNLLLGQDGKLLHYRTPTEAGSSGSPVFDAEWRLIGLHHSYRSKVAGAEGPYPANEGISIFDILKAIQAAKPKLPPRPKKVVKPK